MSRFGNRAGKLKLRLGIVVVVVIVLAMGAKFGQGIFARTFLPTGNAQWIWAQGQEHLHEPIAFYAMREFNLSFQPSQAELIALGDEEFVLFLNGIPIAASRYADGQATNVYRVEDLLSVGSNRLLVELRSTRGVGAFLFRLEIAGNDQVLDVVSDASWQIFLEPASELFDGGATLSKGAVPQVWGHPPAGRWAVSRTLRQAPTIGQLRIGEASDHPTRWRSYNPDDPKGWQRLKRSDRFSPALGSWLTFDWQQEITGYLALRLPPDAPPDSVPIGLIFVGARPPKSQQVRPDAFLVGTQGQRVWLDSEPRTFRFVTFAGLSDVSGAEVYRVDPEMARELIEAGESSNETGAFGLRSTRLRTPLENEIWSELHGLTSAAGGEDS